MIYIGAAYSGSNAVNLLIRVDKVTAGYVEGHVINGSWTIRLFFSGRFFIVDLKEWGLRQAWIVWSSTSYCGDYNEAIKYATSRMRNPSGYLNFWWRFKFLYHEFNRRVLGAIDGWKNPRSIKPPVIEYDDDIPF